MLARAAICLDANAGAPPRPEVVAALLPLLQGEGCPLFNPSSTHSLGRKARRLLNQSKDQVAESLGSGIHPDSLLFTSSGTEANQTVIRGILEARLLRGEKPHWILSQGEHDSVYQMMAWLERRGGRVSLLPLKKDGCIDFSELPGLLCAETALLSFLWVNNETGVISDVAQAANIANSAGVPLHLDAAQAWGKLPLEIAGLGASFISFSAHKIGGLSGTGVLWSRPGGPALDPIFTGKRPKELRAGTENLLGIFAAGIAAKHLEPVEWAERVGRTRERMERELVCRIPGVRFNGADAPRIANTLSVSLPGCAADSLIMNLDLAGFAVSAGAACASGTFEPSRVICAMGGSKELAQSTLRISLQDELGLEEADRFVAALTLAVGRAAGASAIHGQEHPGEKN